MHTRLNVFYLGEYEVMCMYKDLQENMNTSQGLSKTDFQKLFNCLGLKWQIVRIHASQSECNSYHECLQ